METEKLIVSIDLGSSHIVGIAGKREGDKVRIIAVEREPSDGAIRRGAVANIEEAASKVKKLVTKLENKLAGRIDRVYVGLGGQSVRSIRHTASRHLPEGSKISEALLTELYNEGRNFSIANSEIIDIIPNETVVNDFIAEQPLGMSGSKIQIDMQLAVARQALAKNIKAVFDRIKLPVAGIILSAKADATATLSQEDKAAGCALVNFGGGTTTVSVYCGGFLRYFATIPLGGKNITRDIISLGFVDAEAERFKITLGSAILSNGEQLKGITLEGQGKNSIKPKDLNRTAVARMEEIAVNVVNQIKESGYKSQLKGGIIITGNASLLKDLPELLHKESGMDVRCGNISESVIADKNLNAQLSQYSQAIGMILLGGDVCMSREQEKEKQGFWPFGGEKKQQKPQPEKQQPVQVKQEHPKPEKREEKKGGGIFDKIKTQIVDMMGEDENEDINNKKK